MTPASDDGHYYSEETALAQAATRLARPAKVPFASRCVRRALLIPKANPGSVYRCGKSAFKSSLVGHDRRKGGLKCRPKRPSQASYVEFAKPNSPAPVQTQAIFVYRHSQMALSWYTVQRAASADKMNDDFWMKGTDGQICVERNRGGPAWNFSNPRAADFFVDEVIGELTREADINAVFFDETDSEYCGGDTCHNQFLAPDYYAAKIEVLRRTAAKLNNHSIWPMFSSFNENVAQSRCSLPYSDYFHALQGVGWIRFCAWPPSHPAASPAIVAPSHPAASPAIVAPPAVLLAGAARLTPPCTLVYTHGVADEFFGVSSLENFMQEAASGLPVVVHAPGNMADNLALATFLLGPSYRTAASCSLRRALLTPQLSPGSHSIAAVRALKSGLLVTARRKGA